MLEVNPVERKHPDCVYKAKNGQDYKRLSLFDFNSLVKATKVFYFFHLMENFSTPLFFKKNSPPDQGYFLKKTSQMFSN